ncbi:MAG TPA: FAD-binding oxidoreductase [Jatrophihabitans sp.]|jgi:FAD/FMN-containing dehydrogenase
MTFTVPTGAAVSTDAFAELASALPGQVVLPTDAAYDTDRLGFALAVDQRPTAVVHVQDAQDVVTAVRFAVRHGMTVTVQPIGHGATRASNGTVLLRTRGISHIHVDPEQQVARVGAGVKWGELLAVAGPLGLTGLAGSNSDPSVAGFCLSGGLSWFSRKHGVAAHSIRAVEIVDPQGELRVVTADSDPDLFWAVRGAGGDFGVVTAIEVQLYPAEQLYGGRIMWPLEMARPVLRAFHAISANAPDELTTWAHLLRFPPVPFLPEPIRGKNFVSVEFTYLGSAEEAEALIAPLRELPAVAIDATGAVPVANLSGICQEPTDPIPTIEWSRLLTGLDVTDLDRLVDAAGADAPNALTIIQLRHLGGELARGSAAQGPNAAIEEDYLVFCLGVPMVPELVPAIQGSIAAVQQALAGRLSERTFYTFLSADADVTRAFSAESLERLRRVKAEHDPNRVFRSNRPI